MVEENCEERSEEGSLESDTEIGELSAEELESSIEDMINKAAEKGLPKLCQQKLSMLIKTYKSVWRKCLGPDPPANVTPFVTQLKPSVEPYRCKKKFDRRVSEVRSS
jgi:hypothetical protein